MKISQYSQSDFRDRCWKLQKPWFKPLQILTRAQTKTEHRNSPVLLFGCWQCCWFVRFFCSTIRRSFYLLAFYYGCSIMIMLNSAALNFSLFVFPKGRVFVPPPLRAIGRCIVFLVRPWVYMFISTMSRKQSLVDDVVYVKNNPIRFWRSTVKVIVIDDLVQAKDRAFKISRSAVKGQRWRSLWLMI